jgi:hypothetical protein
MSRTRREALALAACVALGAEPASITVLLERLEGEDWKTIDPKLVLDKGDRIRFRMKTTVAGYLYVHYRSSEGETAWLFPREDSSETTRVEDGRMYEVPRAGFFTVEGPPGYDVVYWLIMPARIPSGLPRVAPRTPRAEPDTLRSRCRETADRRPCLDEGAGAAAVGQPETVFPDLAPSPALRPRRIDFESRTLQTQVQGERGRPILHEFRIAHR